MEIELRAFVDDLNKFRKNVEAIGASFEAEQHIVDYWFCEKNKNSFSEVRQEAPGSYGLRIRKSIDEDKETTEICCKVLKSHGDHNSFYEHETKVEDFEQARKILESIGFKVFCIIDKKRRKYRLGKFSINLEDIKGFRPAVELEIIADEDAGHKESLKELFKKLGVKEDNIIGKSITRVYMEENSFR